MGLFFILLYDFVGQFLATIHPDIGIKFCAHQSSFGRRVLRVVCGEGGFSLGRSFKMVATNLLQDSRNPSRAGKSTDIPAIAQDLFKSLSFPAYPINNALGVASNKILFGRISTYFGKVGFQFFSCNPRIFQSTLPWIHEAPQHFSPTWWSTIHLFLD
jgi:hypothetical protein